ncbi:MAG TPA: CRISPR-associated endonuclease Cas2 [Aggregatilineales bacterium]|nr:CRISPR-associated endonuclease Cas2 [Aggregatilineales bacterium]
MMNILLVYDITDDKARAKIADTCLDYGLDRTQFSAFIGRLTHTLQEELFMRLERVLRKSGGGGKIQLIPICAKDWAARMEIAQEGEPRPEEASDG